MSRCLGAPLHKRALNFRQRGCVAFSKIVFQFHNISAKYFHGVFKYARMFKIHTWTSLLNFSASTFGCLFTFSIICTFGQSVSSVAQSCPTLCDPMDCSMPGFPVHHQLPEFTQTHVHWVGDAIQPSYPLSSPSPPAPNPPSIRVFSNESTLRMRWPKNWSFSFSVSPSNEHPGLISFRMDWLDLLAVQGTLKSLL